MLDNDKGLAKNFPKSVVFSTCLFLSLAVVFGSGAHLALIAPAVLILANLFFLRWRVGGRAEVIFRTAITSLGFTCALFLLQIVWLKLFPSGQVGYGDRMQIDGSHITLLGYGVLFKSAGFVGFLTFGSALLASILIRGKDDNAI